MPHVEVAIYRRISSKALNLLQFSLYARLCFDVLGALLCCLLFAMSELAGMFV